MHADLSIFLFGKRIFTSRMFHSENKEAFERIEDLGYKIILIGEEPHSPYPFDIPLCARALGSEAIMANERYTAGEILELCRDEKVRLINVKQGYSACTSLCIGGVITSDSGISSALAREGAEVLKISSGSVLLPGFDYGFIGGASGVDRKKILFCGSLDTHPNYKEIQAFASRFGVECISLSELPLLDVGGLFFI